MDKKNLRTPIPLWMQKEEIPVWAQAEKTRIEKGELATTAADIKPPEAAKRK